MAAVNLASLLPSINFSTTTLAVLTVSGALVGLYVAIKAAKLVRATLLGGYELGGRVWDEEEYAAGLWVVKDAIRKGHVVDKESRDALARYEGSQTKKRSSAVKW